MTNILRILSVLLILTSCSSGLNNNADQDPSTDGTAPKDIQVKSVQDILGLKGNVKLLKQDEYYPGQGDATIGTRTENNSYSYRFDDRGNLVGSQYLDQDGIVDFYSEYEYSSKGEKLMKKFIGIDGELKNTYKYVCDKYGRVIKTMITDYETNRSYEYYVVSEYDEYGNEIKSSTYTMDHIKLQSSKSVFENNLNTELILYDNNDIPVAISKFAHNSNGDVIREHVYTGNNLFFEEYSFDYTYDDNNNWIKRERILEDKRIITEANVNREIGLQTVTLRTFIYR